MNSVEIVNANGLEICIDRRNGGITRISHPATGMLLNIDPERAGLVDLAYPVEAFYPLRLSSKFSKADVEKWGKGVKITWNALLPNRQHVLLPDGGVRAEVYIYPSEDESSVIMICRIENKSENPIPQVMFPDLHGLRPFAGAEDTNLRMAAGVVQPFKAPLKAPHTSDYYINRYWRRYAPGPFGSQNWIRWIDYGSISGGLSVFQKKWGTPDMPTIYTYNSEREPMSLRLLWEHSQVIGPGETWESGEFWFTGHEGGWAKGIEQYRKYAKQRMSSRKVPSHVMNGLGFQTIWMNQALESDPQKAAFVFKDLPKVAADAKEHGIDELVLWGWCNYFDMPIRVNENLGTPEEFLEAIRQCKELGVNVAPFVSILTVKGHLAEKYGVPSGKPGWAYHPDLIPIFKAPYITPWEEGVPGSENQLWLDDVRQSLLEWIERGVYSISWDQFQSLARSDGRKPTLVELVEEIRAIAQERDDEATFSGEIITPNAFEVTSVLDYTWNWHTSYFDIGPILNVFPYPRVNINVEDSALVVKKCFIDGVYINAMPTRPDQPNGTALISDEPEMAAALKEAARLRRQFLPYFAEGVFIGDSVLSYRVPAFIKGRVLSNRLLICILNDSNESRIITLGSNLGLWLPSAKQYEIKYYDSKGDVLGSSVYFSSLWTGTTKCLKPLELAFFEIIA